MFLNYYNIILDFVAIAENEIYADIAALPHSFEILFEVFEINQYLNRKQYDEIWF